MFSSLSMGERRALYILYVLFDLENFKSKNIDNEHLLIIADDIADSFDYKNKYAIIEYLLDFAKDERVELLLLTHNFDFFRTVQSRGNIFRGNCFIVQKAKNNSLEIKNFLYLKDYFKNVIIRAIKEGDFSIIEKAKKLIAGIPFYRNLADYAGNSELNNSLTCCLHYMSAGFKPTKEILISDIFNAIKGNAFPTEAGDIPLRSADENYLEVLFRIADSILEDQDEVNLENKLVISIAARIKAEMFMFYKLNSNCDTIKDYDENQTMKLYIDCKKYLSESERKVIEELQLMTPEHIHLNSFMYEPLIDVSSWGLKELYKSINDLYETILMSPENGGIVGTGCPSNAITLTSNSETEEQ